MKPTMDHADHTVEQPLARYTAEDQTTWRTLFEHQAALLPGRACAEFLAGLRDLGLTSERIPDFAHLSHILGKATGWSIVAVTGLLPDEVFFEHLASRRFPVTWWIRKPEQVNYLQEPDLFHDLYGHVPLLMNPVFADYMQAYGQGGMKAKRLGEIPHLARLYWYTVEFGLIRDASSGELRIYGSGILSSRAESVYCLESPRPNRIAFDLFRVMRTRYRIDAFQETYFVIPSFKQLFDDTLAEFAPYYERLRSMSDLRADEVLESDCVITRGESQGPGDREDAN